MLVRRGLWLGCCEAEPGRCILWCWPTPRMMANGACYGTCLSKRIAWKESKTSCCKSISRSSHLWSDRHTCTEATRTIPFADCHGVGHVFCVATHHTHTHTHPHTHSHTHTHTHTHPYIHTHTHTQTHISQLYHHSVSPEPFLRLFLSFVSLLWFVGKKWHVGLPGTLIVFFFGERQLFYRHFFCEISSELGEARNWSPTFVTVAWTGCPVSAWRSSWLASTRSRPRGKRPQIQSEKRAPVKQWPGEETTQLFGGLWSSMCHFMLFPAYPYNWWFLMTYFWRKLETNNHPNLRENHGVSWHCRGC